MDFQIKARVHGKVGFIHTLKKGTKADTGAIPFQKYTFVPFRYTNIPFKVPKCMLKRIVHPKMKILSVITLPIRLLFKGLNWVTPPLASKGLKMASPEKLKTSLK